MFSTWHGLWIFQLEETRRTASDEILRDKAFHIAINQKDDGYQGGLPSMVNILIKKIMLVVLKMRICQTKN